MFSKKFSSNIRKKKKFVVIVIFLGIIGLGLGYAAFYTDLSIYGNYKITGVERNLYNVMAEEYIKNSGFVKKYTGTHYDTFNGSGEEDIYYWNAINDENANLINNKNNVIFGGNCWKMLRTTDGGGVKMIYNGLEENGKCLSSRSLGVDFHNPEVMNLSENSYVYGNAYSISTYQDTKYIYISSYSNNGSSINNVEKKWDASIGPGLVGYYTCKTLSSRCDSGDLYYIAGYENENEAKVIKINLSTNYTQIGNVSYNSNSNSLADVGYMYNERYITKSKSISEYGNKTVNINSIEENDYNVIENNNNSFQFNNTSKKYETTLTNSHKSSKMKFNFDLSGDVVLNYDVLNNDASSDITLELYYDNNKIKTFNGNGNGSLFLDNYTNNKNVEIKFFTDSISSSAELSFSVGTAVGNVTDTRFLFGNDVSYENGTYTLRNTKFSEIGEDLSNHHYTCFNTTGVCEAVHYIHYIDNTNTYYIDLTDGNTINDAKDQMLSGNNINLKKSTIDMIIEAWYKGEKIEKYADVLDDSVFYNYRDVNSMGGWNSNGGDMNKKLTFHNFESPYNIDYSNVVNQFSMNNDKAQTSIKASYPSLLDLSLLEHNGLRKTNYPYWYNGAAYFTDSAYNYIVDAAGNMTSVSKTDSLNGIRPVIVTIPETMYSGGNGSEDNPYYIATYHVCSCVGLVGTKTLRQLHSSCCNSTGDFRFMRKDGVEFPGFDYIDTNGFPLPEKAGYYGTWCLSGETEVEVYDKKKKKRYRKKLRDVTPDDLILCWDFDKGEFDFVKPLWIMKEEWSDYYYLLKFSDNSQLKIVGDHKVFDVDKGRFINAGNENELEIGSHVLNSKGEIVELISWEIVYEKTDACNVITDYHMNLFANGILTSCVFSNIHPIQNLKYQDTNSDKLLEKELKDIPKKYIKGLRLNEVDSKFKGTRQSTINYVKEYIDKLISKEKKL